ncbi:RpiR family transcriptional regulator [Sedimentitalea sp. CY04]|uniref:MurR/RpiR family transcriptional regulator n=2 Tax=Parasedimentitalea TaxID=2738399 RepID=A0A6A4RDK1_9RHOB|nr:MULTISPECIES: MurR/RpiR family transcriptional regulator [Paracoccaceae]KAE9625955.1 MurR/RpiR family transcriptional regulator [Zongyanglinia marina]NIZ63260.1 RpiR family transcriptional regulator [Sedimentitalea sp. CY04]
MKDVDTSPLSEVVKAFDGKLTGSDRSILSVILNDPEQSVFLSATQLAEEAQVHASTVVRLARKLGFQGYPELRDRLRTEVKPGVALSQRSQQRMVSIEQGSNLSALIESEIEALHALQKSISQTQINAAAERLANANTIHIVGRGGAAPLTVHLDRRLRRNGYTTNVALNMQRRDLAEKFMGLRKGDAVIFFAFQAPESLPAGYAGLIAHTARIGAHSILICDSTGLTARPRPDITLMVNRPDEGVMQLRTGPMVLCEALAMTLAHKNPERAVDGLEALEILRTNLLNDKD